MKLSWRRRSNSKPEYRRIDTPRPLELLITDECLSAITDGIRPQTRKKREGVVYLYGRTDGLTTLAVGAIVPDAQTTAGSFYVQTSEVARMVKEIRRRGLQLICQIHTHPTIAYHSDGDVKGLKLICDGYVSVVLPNYGVYLPSFRESVFFFYRRDQGFVKLQENAVRIIPSRIP